MGSNRVSGEEIYVVYKNGHVVKSFTTSKGAKGMMTKFLKWSKAGYSWYAGDYKIIKFVPETDALSGKSIVFFDTAMAEREEKEREEKKAEIQRAKDDRARIKKEKAEAKAESERVRKEKAAARAAKAAKKENTGLGKIAAKAMFKL